MDDPLVDASTTPLVEEQEETKKPAAADGDEEKTMSVVEKLKTIVAHLWKRSSVHVAAFLSEAEETTVTSVSTSIAIAMVLAAVYLALDPLGLIADLMDFHPQSCKPYECLLPVPDMNEWPADPSSKLLNSSLAFDTDIPGPESLAWDAQGRIYTGVADGRVIRWDESNGYWETFAFVSPYRDPELCDFKNRGKEYAVLEHVCGRPLGLKFDASGSLYIADAYFGLAVVGPEGGLATILCNESEGQVHLFTNDVDIDDEEGVVYFTVSSLRSQRRLCNRLVQEADQTGRVLKYDPKIGKATVLLKDFKYPNGIALPQDKSFLLIVSTTTNRIMKYWLKGQKAGEMEEFARQPGYGDNIRATEDRKFFWVALHSRRHHIHYLLANRVWLARLITPPARMSKRLRAFVTGEAKPMVIKYNIDGEAIQALEDRTGLSNANFLSTAQERLGRLWLSSIYLPHILVYNLRD